MLKQLITKITPAMLGVVLFLSSCKERAILTPEFIPAIDNINTFATDTLSLTCKTVLTDNLRTSGFDTTMENFNIGSTAFLALGNISNDPDFGITSASLALNLVQPKTSYVFPDTLVSIDSCVLIIPYLGSFGDTSFTSPKQNLNVYRLGEALDYKTNYYSNSTLARSDFLGSATFNLGKQDTQRVNGYVGKHLRIKLNNTFAKQLVDLSGKDDYKTFNNFLKWFKGIIIEPNNTNEGNALAYINARGSFINLHSTYKPDTGIVKLISTYAFNPSICASAMLLNRKINPSHAAYKYINNPGPNGDSVCFLQTNTGAAMEITINNLTAFRNSVGRVAINKATFELPILAGSDPLADSMFRRCPTIKAFGVNGAGIESQLYEYDYRNNNGFYRYVIGLPVLKEVGQKKIIYKINLIKTIQKALDEGQNSVTIRIKGVSERYAFGRAVIAGTGRIADNAKISLIYTKI
jgi:hypothetical protein